MKDIPIIQNCGILVASETVYPQLIWCVAFSSPFFFLGILASSSSLDFGILTKNIDSISDITKAIAPNLI